MPCPRTQLFQPSSTIPFSYSGPRKSIIVNATDLTVSVTPTGHQPRRWRASMGVRCPHEVMTRNVEVVVMMQDRVTARMRPRITEGASRESCGDGRVVEET